MRCLRPLLLQCTSNNSYVTEFTDGKRIEMGGEELREAKKLFAAELMKLTKANVSKTNVASTEVQASDMAKTAAQAMPQWTDIDAQAMPLWTDIDDIPYDCERAYEVEFDGSVPKMFVGIEFPEKKNASKAWNLDMLELWEVSCSKYSTCFSSLIADFRQFSSMSCGIWPRKVWKEVLKLQPNFLAKPS